MKTEIWMHKGIVAAAVVFVLAISPLTARDALASDSPRVARLSGIVDEALILGKDDVEWSYAEPNLIVEEGDLLQTNETGRAEVHFDRGMIFRIGERTRVAVIEMYEQKVVGMDNGRGYLRVARELYSDEAFTLTFPTGQLTALDKTLTRIDISEDGRAELNVVRGSVELETKAGYAAHVRAGERVLINSQGVVDFAGQAIARRDDFDLWNEERDIALSTYRRPQYIEEDIVGEEELYGYGEWVYVEGYKSYAWRPYVVEVWKPYYNGHWYYSHNYGWTWVPEEPWGYVTYHYGSWNYDPHYRWVWIPGYVWRPSHVSWITYEDYVGWVPLGYYDYPVITTYPYHVTNIYIGYFDILSFVFAHRHHFHHHHGHDGPHWNYGDRPGHPGGHHPGHPGGHDPGPPSPYRPGQPSAGHPGPSHGGIRFADDGKIDIDKNKWGKIRFEKNLGNASMKERYFKGRTSREKVDYDKIIDTRKHPELNRRIAKQTKWRDRVRKEHPDLVSHERPKKTQKDEARSFDFRKNGNTRNSAASVDRLRPRASQDASTVRRSAREKDGAVQRQTEMQRSARTGSDSPMSRFEQSQKLRNGRPSGEDVTNRRSTVRRTAQPITSQALSSTDRPAVPRKTTADVGRGTRAGNARDIARSPELPKVRALQGTNRFSRERIQTDRQSRQFEQSVIARTMASAPAQGNRAGVNQRAPVNTAPMRIPAAVERSGSMRRLNNDVSRNMQVPQMRRQQAAPRPGQALQARNPGAFAGSRIGTPRVGNNSRTQSAAAFRGNGMRHR